jgi:hypothetical protein
MRAAGRMLVLLETCKCGGTRRVRERAQRGVASWWAGAAVASFGLGNQGGARERSGPAASRQPSELRV